MKPYIELENLEEETYEIIAKNHITGITKDYTFVNDFKGIEYIIAYHISDGRKLVGCYKTEKERDEIFNSMKKEIWGFK